MTYKRGAASQELFKDIPRLGSNLNKLLPSAFSLSFLLTSFLADEINQSTPLHQYGNRRPQSRQSP